MTEVSGETMEVWRNRIVESGEGDPEQLLANPKNWRIHPLLQQESLLEILRKVGWVGKVMVNINTGTVIDGHLRVALAIKYEQPAIPIDWVDVSEEEEELILQTFDPIGAMARADRTKIAELAESVFAANEKMQGTLKDIAEGAGLPKVGRLKPEESTGALLDLIDVAIEDPRHKVHKGEVWRLGHHVLVVLDVMDDWKEWVLWLERHAQAGGEIAFIPYPGPFVPLSKVAATVRMVMVQPDKYVAGHILDQYENVNGKKSVEQLTDGK
jgi:hypothetical protein